MRDNKRLIEEFGRFSVDFFSVWIVGLIEKKTKNPAETFRDIHEMGVD